MIVDVGGTKIPTQSLINKEVACLIVLLFVGASISSVLGITEKGKILRDTPKELPVGRHIAYACDVYRNSFVEFYLDDPGNLTDDNNSGIWVWSGADFDENGNWYGVSFTGGLYGMNVDGTIYYICYCIPCDSLVYNTASSLWYAASSSFGTDSLFTIDVNTGVTTFVGSFGISNTMISLMCDTDGNLYGYDVLFNGDSHLYSIDKDTGEATSIGDMGYDFCYAQEGKFDRDNNILYIAGYILPEGKSALLTCNPQTGACAMVGYFPNGTVIDALAIPYWHPYATFTWTPPAPLPKEPVLFNASASYSPDGNITLYEWDWDKDGVYENSSTSPTMTHTWTNPGSYQVTLRVTDDTGGTARKVQTVDVVDHPPLSPVITGPDNGTTNHAYTFTTGPITDPDGDSMYIMWDWGDGTTTDWLGPFVSGQTITASYTWTHVGVYGMRAKLKDIYGAESNWSDPHTITITDDEAPCTPVVNGSAKGKVGETYLYTFVTTDPEDDDVFYYIDWGDGTHTGWLGPYQSGEAKSASHSWNNEKTFTVKVKAKDMYGNESDWGTLKVTMPLSYEPLHHRLLEWLFQRFPYAFPILHYLLGR
jgi:PKD repeat protein